MSTHVDILPILVQAGPVTGLHRVAIVAIGAAWEGFGIDRSDDGIPVYDTALVSMTESVQTNGGWSLSTPHRLDWAAEADLVIVPAFDADGGEIGPILDLLRETVARGARVMSLCTGAFALGRAGLLDGRECTTHWKHSQQLAEQYPLACVNPDVLFVCDGPVLTSAGTAAGLDLCLHVIRSEHGEEIARRVARRMVMSPHREGGQAQYVEAPIRTNPADTLAPLLEALLDELCEEHSIESLAARSAMSPRTFARRFLQETGTTPHKWLTHQRVLRAQLMLEAGEESIEKIADDSGFPTSAMLRHHFTRVVGASPSAYRRQFCSRTD
jgi:transcriptional regulator GlxA family with amidase domain